MSHSSVGTGLSSAYRHGYIVDGLHCARRPVVGFGTSAYLRRSRFIGVTPFAQWTPALSPAQNRTSTAPPPPLPPSLERAGDLPDRLLEDYLNVWSSQYTEYDYYVPPEAVYGSLPEDLKGTLFLVGPGLTEVYGTTVRHPSDADGMVCSLAFGGEGGRIFFRNRYVRTPSFVAEQALGRRITRGIHDRGAPTPVDHSAPTQSPQQQQQQQQRQHPHQRQPSQGVDRMRSPSLGQGQGYGKAGSTHVNSELWEGEEGAEERRYRERASSAAVTGGVAGLAARAQSASSSSAAASGPSASRAWPLRSMLDPLAMLGLPPLPPLSALFNPLDTSFRAPANANVVYWAGRLLAFTEGGSLPYELHKLSLETVGPYNAAGAMADIGRIVAGYKIAPAPPPPTSSTHTSTTARQRQPQQRLVLMGAAQSGPDVLLRWVELGEDGTPAAAAAPAAAGPAGSPAATATTSSTTSTSYRLPGAAAQGILDFWVTERHYVVVQAPLDFNPQRFATRATLGTASFVECFDWDPSRPSRVHLVPRAQAPPTATSSITVSTATSRGPAGASPSTAATSARKGEGSSGSSSMASSSTSGRKGTEIVWPSKGPEAIVIDVPPLLLTSSVDSYSLGQDGDVLILDGICQQGLTGSLGGTLDSRNVGDHRHQPKPELTRIVLDLSSRTATARVLSQRTAFAAATPTAAAIAAVISSSTTGTTAAVTVPASGSSSDGVVGGSSSSGNRYIYAATSATDAADGWAPPQAIVKLSIPTSYGIPAGKAAVATTGGGMLRGISAECLARRRGVGSEVWAPGDRVFVGPPVFVPKQQQQCKGRRAVHAAAATKAPSAPKDAYAGADASPLPPLESEVDALPGQSRGQQAAAEAGRQEGEQHQQQQLQEQEHEQEGWLLVLVHDAETMRAELCILDAQQVTRGPVAVISLPHHLPHVRAAHFTRMYCGPGLAAPPGWKPRTASAAPKGVH